jgi:hypothetical protein
MHARRGRPINPMHMQGLDFGGGSRAGGRAAISADELAEVYDIMLTHGFREEHVQRALQACTAPAFLPAACSLIMVPWRVVVLIKRAAQAVSREGVVSEEAVLDWLCLHVDPGALPRRFAGAARSLRASAGIRVVAKADEQAAALKRCSASPCCSSLCSADVLEHGSAMSLLFLRTWSAERAEMLVFASLLFQQGALARKLLHSMQGCAEAAAQHAGLVTPLLGVSTGSRRTGWRWRPPGQQRCSRS